MANRKNLILIFALTLYVLPSYGQFWFGVKSGIQLINQVYQEEGYTDIYNLKDNIINWHVGGVFNYTTSDKYSIHTELLYERVRRETTSSPDTIFVDSELTYHFITAPVMFRVQFGRTPIRYYINAGPQIRYWVTGKGRMMADELFENSESGTRNYRIRFKDSSDNPDLSDYFVPNPNRVQYAFAVGGGVVLDLFNRSQRLMIDGRYSFGHSNMGFNRGTEPSQLSTYGENFEFRDNTITISLAYLFGFNPMDVRQGASTIKKSKLK